MSVNALQTVSSALYANQVRLNVGANNISNVNTDGFQASTVTTTDSAYIDGIGSGVKVSGIYTPSRPGPVTPAAQPSASGEQAGMTTLSNTDMVVEMSNMMAARQAYSANIVMGEVVEDATQTLFDIKR